MAVCTPPENFRWCTDSIVQGWPHERSWQASLSWVCSCSAKEMAARKLFVLQVSGEHCMCDTGLWDGESRGVVYDVCLEGQGRWASCSAVQSLSDCLEGCMLRD